jgi:Mu transposase, C-terminal domain
VAIDALIDLDTVRYSVPHRLVRDHVDVVIDEQILRVFHGSLLVATHARSTGRSHVSSTRRITRASGDDPRR